LGNTIQIADPPEVIRKKLSGAFTDEKRLRRADPGHPEECYVCGLQGYFASPEETERMHNNCRTAAWGCVDSKRALAENMIATLAPIRERAVELKAHPERIREILGDGAQAARKVAVETMRDVRARIGLYT
jgi:tryptophanyl-tRNA synthetase